MSINTTIAAQAIFNMYSFDPNTEPAPQFCIGGECTYDDLIWHDLNFDKPTREEYDNAIAEIIKNT